MDVNNLFSGVTVPGWAVIAGGLAFVLLLLLILRPRREGGGVAVVAQLAVVAMVGGVGYYGLKYFADNTRLTERRAIEERAATLLNQAHQPGSVLGCLHAAGESVLDEACEKTVFAEPQRVASAMSITADRIALLYDATIYAAREPAFLDRFKHLRRSLESDPYGLVAHVLANEHKCIPDSCTRFRILKNADNVKANLTSRKFEGLLAKYKEEWVRVRPGMNFGEMNAMPPVNTIGGRVEEDELPSANTAVQMNVPSGLLATTPVIIPLSPNQPEPPTAQAPSASENAEPASAPANQTPTAPAAKNAKQKAAPTQQKRQPVAAQPKQQPQARPKSRPEPVGGLPRVTARGSNPPAEEEEAPAAAPPPPQEPPSIFPNLFRRN